MLQKTILSFLLSLFFISNVSATSYAAPSQFQTIVSSGIFTGDHHGDFANDYVAYLSDGSFWKIHPEDRDMFTNWNVDDVVHVGVRKADYWFKREHKFALVNHTRNQTARVMLVSYPDNALVIVDTLVYTTGYESVSNTVWDSNGNPIFINNYVPVHEKKLMLNDGSIWIIRDQREFKNFNVNHKVYIGWNLQKNGSFAQFIISGIEREANYAWVNL